MERFENICASGHRNRAELKELVYAFAVFGKDTTGDDEQVAVVVGGEASSNEGAGKRRGFDEQSGATDASDEAIALRE